MAAGQYKNKAYPLRIESEIMDQVRELAAQESRTVNKQIEYMLKCYIKEHSDQSEQDAEVLKPFA